MPFDALTIAAVRQELEDNVVGGRVQNVVMPGPLTVALELYRGGTGRINLILSAHPQHARAHLISSTPSRDPEQHPPLLLLLRKYVRGGTLLEVSQPRYERVLILSIAKRLPPDKHQEYHSEGDFMDTADEAEDLSMPATTVQLVVEIMGRVSNIVLVAEDGAIMDSIKRVPSSINRYRVTLPNHAYVPPPPQGKRDPLDSTINAMSMELVRAAEDDLKAPVWKGLVGGYSAVSPTLAREVAFRALGNTKAPTGEVASRPEALQSLLGELQALVSLGENHGWQPSLAVRRGSEGDVPVEFAPYRLGHLESVDVTIEEVSSISEAAARYFAAQGSLGGHSAYRAQVAAELAELRSREARKLSSLEDELGRAQSVEMIRTRGEMLLAYMHSIQPGQRTLAIPGAEFEIELDPDLTPVEQAQAIFREYRKARAAIERVPERIVESQARIAYLDDLDNSLDIAATYDEIRAVLVEITAAGRPPAPEQPKRKGRGKEPRVPQPLRLQTKRGAQMLLGRTAGQNDTATFRLAAPDDLWFHVRNAPGSHVILRAVPDLTQDDIEEAARLAAGYSKLREESNVDVVYAERRYVRRIPNGPPGQATYRNEQVIRVAPAPRLVTKTR
jgi:predicted ribosome quality control (RQC) complex YloA/Tae2 family protein